MHKFYFLLWLKWSVRVTSETFIGTLLFAFFITLYVYFDNGAQQLDKELAQALFQVFQFWFTLLWSLMLLVALFRSLKYSFNQCSSGYKLALLTCKKKSQSEYVEDISYRDLVRVWRKWLMLMIWIVGVQMIFAVVLSKFLTSYSAVFDWFNIYLLFAFIVVAGYFSFILLSSRCKLVRVRRCT